MMGEKTISGTFKLEEIKNASEGELKALYNTYRKEFGMWAIKHYNIEEELAGEIYQRTFIAFYYNVRDGRLAELKSSVKTYLFAIGKNLLRDHFKSTARFVEPSEYEIAPEAVDNSIMDNYERTEQTEMIRGVLEKIGEPCKTVLELYYFRNYSMESIAFEMNYKTEQIASKRKFICLQQIRQLMERNQN
jgi:RNA polymerase sigma-70 factor (ECF subfamily)